MLRSLLFLALGMMLFYITPVGADELVSPRPLAVANAPPLPPPLSERTQLESLRGRLGSKTAEPQQSTPAIRQGTQIPIEVAQPNSLSQASFASRPASSSVSVPREEFTGEELSENSYDKEDKMDAPNEVLAKPLTSKKSAVETVEGESKGGGWKNKLAKQGLTPVLSVAGSLLIVVAAFFLLAILFRKVSPRGNRLLPNEAFECLGRYFLTQKHQLQVLRLGNRVVLVSVMPDGVSTLAEITDPDEAVSFLGLCRRLDTDSATEMFRKTVAGMSEDELSRPYERPVVSRQRGQTASSLDLYSDPDESLASILARGRQR